MEKIKSLESLVNEIIDFIYDDLVGEQAEERIKDIESLYAEWKNNEDEETAKRVIVEYIDKNYDYIICSMCGEIETRASSYEYENELICYECYNLAFETCSSCGEVIPRDNATYCEDDDSFYCECCADDKLLWCDCCESYHMMENVYRVYSYSCRDDDYRHMCSNCIEYNDIYCCDECGEYVEHTNYDEDNDMSLCDYCYGQVEQERNGNICNYGYKPAPVFHATKKEDGKTQKNIAFYGVELEIDRKEYNETKRDTILELQEILGDFAYYKRDGSLSDDGVEIVTHPASLNKWLELKGTFTKAFETCVKAGYRSHNTSTCGLHIHASREFLAEDRTQQDEIIDRIILIIETFKEQIKKFSRRNNYSYCGFLSDKVYADNKEEYIKKIENIKKEKGNHGRYVTLNVENYNTIELRVMRGTLNIETFYASLQLFHNIIEIAKNNALEKLQGLTWNNIIKLNNFEELQAYNGKRNIENDTILVIKKNKGV